MTEIYLTYERGDCAEVMARTGPEEIDQWGIGEIRFSTLLLRGFCSELGDDPRTARRIYRELIASAPLSFAAEDARERLRVLDLGESEASRERRIRAALERANPNDPDNRGRTPVRRAPARYPPVAQLASVEGYAVVQFGVTRAGETIEPTIVESYPPLLFDGVAVRAVREWRFARDGRADPDDQQLIRLRFTIDSAARPDESGRTTDERAD